MQHSKQDDHQQQPQSSACSPPCRLSLMELVSAVTAELSDSAVIGESLLNLRLLMESYDHQLNEWERFSSWDKKKNYTRNLIATDDQHFTLMLLCWNPLSQSPIHNHSGSQCFMRVVTGTVKETQFFPPQAGSPPAFKSSSIATEGSVVFINDSIGIHRVDNPLPVPAVTLHLYVPPYQQVFCYDETTGTAKESHITYDSEQGQDNNSGQLMHQ